MDFSADLPVFYSDFGVDVVIAGDTAHPVRGIFDAHYADALGLVAGTRPVLRLARSVPVVRGTLVNIGGVDYRLKAPEPNGNDEIIWPLEKV